MQLIIPALNLRAMRDDLLPDNIFDWPLTRRGSIFQDPDVYEPARDGLFFGSSLVGPSLIGRELEQLQKRRRQQDRLRFQLEELNGGIERALGLLGESYAFPSIQVISDDSTSAVKMDVPGMTEKDVVIQIDDDIRALRVSGKREMVEDGVTTFRKFSTAFQLDERARMDELKATLENGVLTVSAPKEPEKEKESKTEIKLRRIPIQILGDSDKVKRLEVFKSKGEKEALNESNDEPAGSEKAEKSAAKKNGKDSVAESKKK